MAPPRMTVFLPALSHLCPISHQNGLPPPIILYTPCPPPSLI